MKYGQGFWVVRNCERVRDRAFAYPQLLPFEYQDGSGDAGWLALEDFCFDYVKPCDPSGLAWRFTVSGDPDPVPGVNAFDFDGASVPQVRFIRAFCLDKMDHRCLVAAFVHDMGHCIHEWKTGFTRMDWNRALSEIGEAYGMTAWARAKYKLAVDAAGWACYSKTDEELARYRALVKIERVPL